MKSIGFTALLAVFIKIFGLSASVGFNMTAFIATMSIALIFLFTYLLFQKENVSLFSALILAFHPLHLRWSGSISSEIVSLFFIILTFTCLLLYIKARIPILISTLLILFFTLSIREENLAILPFFKELKSELRSKEGKKAVIRTINKQANNPSISGEHNPGLSSCLIRKLNNQRDKTKEIIEG